jgi:hypothetical protein
MKFYRLLTMVLLTGLLLCPLTAAAEELVSGHYLTGVGKEIKIELEIGSPAPPLVIVIQNLPPGTGVISSRPRLKKYDPKKGEAKWLLNKVKPGKTTVSLQLDRAVGAGELSGEIRSRMGGGKMVSSALKN